MAGSAKLKMAGWNRFSRVKPKQCARCLSGSLAFHNRVWKCTPPRYTKRRPRSISLALRSGKTQRR